MKQEVAHTDVELKDVISATAVDRSRAFLAQIKLAQDAMVLA